MGATRHLQRWIHYISPITPPCPKPTSHQPTTSSTSHHLQPQLSVGSAGLSAEALNSINHCPVLSVTQAQNLNLGFLLFPSFFSILAPSTFTCVHEHAGAHTYTHTQWLPNPETTFMPFLLKESPSWHSHCHCPNWDTHYFSPRLLQCHPNLCSCQILGLQFIVLHTSIGFIFPERVLWWYHFFT